MDFTELLIESPRITATEKGITAVHKYEVDDGRPAYIANHLSALGLAYGTAHVQIPDIYITNVAVDPVDIEHSRITVTYSKGKNDERSRENAYGEVWEWELGTSQVHITSVADPDNQVHSPAQLNVGTAIGKDGDDVQGVDVYRPASTLRVTKRVAGASVTSTFRRNLIDMQATVNHGNWKDWKKGEVLFLGASLSPLDTGEWSVIYNFLTGITQEELKVYLQDGTNVTVFAEAWEYIWYTHVGEVKNLDENGNEDGEGAVAVNQTGIEGVHLAKVYGYGNFGNFNLGGP